MLQFEHKWRIVQACYPENEAIAQELWHDIKPTRFGEAVLWAAGTTPLVTYQIPPDSSFMLVARVECYTTTFVVAAPGFGQFSPPPNATAFWQNIDTVTTIDTYRESPQVPIHVLCDVDEFLFFKSDQRIALQAVLPAAPDANARFIRTLVYAYLCGPVVADRIGDSESLLFGATS